jgi:gamma-glutamyltranspeptidase / glutathione hydrolase
MHRSLIAVLITSTICAFAQDRTNARSMVLSPYGIVATSQVQASQAGAEILSRGGSAIDAAIAANATLGVMEPDMNGIGGDLFAIYWEAKTGKLYGLNSSGWAPKALTIERLKSKGETTMPGAGIDSVTVPGAVEGWNELHKRFGRLAWKDLFAPAIFYAVNGFAVQEMTQQTGKHPNRSCSTIPNPAASFSSTTKLRRWGNSSRIPISPKLSA